MIEYIYSLEKLTKHTYGSDMSTFTNINVISDIYVSFTAILMIALCHVCKLALQC